METNLQPDRRPETRGRRVATVGLVLGSVAFGMVVAGGLSWTPASLGEETPATPPVQVTPPPPGTPMAGFADLAEAVAPAVVSIRTVSFENGGDGPAEEESPLFDFFSPRRPDAAPQTPEEFRSEAGGSGFLVSPQGLIVTNNHVISGASEVRVQMDDGREYTARVRGVDEETDLALLQVERAEAFPYLKIGRSESLRVGDWVMVIGNPLRLGRTVTVGVVSATGRTLNLTNPSFENFIQTDAAINFGNSGGPMVNLAGEVVGIATAVNWGAENIGFAVPARTLSQVLPALEEEGRVRRGYLGVNIENLDFRSQKAFGLESAEGALVVQVVPDSPAAQGGVDHADIILAIDGEPVSDTRDLIDTIAQRPPGATVVLDVLREGRRIQRKVTLGERPAPDAEVQTEPEDETSGVEWLGLTYQSLTPGLKAAHGIPSEVDGIWLRTISPRSPLVDEGLQPGDLVTEVNGQPVTDPESFERAVEGIGSGSYVRLYVQRYDRRGQVVQFFAFVEVP